MDISFPNSFKLRESDRGGNLAVEKVEMVVFPRRDCSGTSKRGGVLHFPPCSSSADWLLRVTHMNLQSCVERFGDTIVDTRPTVLTAVTAVLWTGMDGQRPSRPPSVW